MRRLAGVCILLLLTINAAAETLVPGMAQQEIDHSLRQGNFSGAIAQARQAIERNSHNKKSTVYLDALLALANAYQAAGQQHNAIVTLRSALELAETLDDSAKRLEAMAGLGQSYARSGQTEQAQRWLATTAQAAARADKPDVEAATLINLGNMLLDTLQSEKALETYKKAANIGEANGLLQLKAQAFANAARAALAINNNTLATEMVVNSSRTFKSLDVSHETAYLLINTALLLVDIQEATGEANPQWLREPYKLLRAAQEMGETLRDYRAQSWATGHIARLYLQEGRIPEALTLTSEALYIAEQNSIPDVLYYWQWQAGRILDKQGKTTEAIDAYRAAVRTLQPIRYDITASYGDRTSAFREIIGPLYFELVDLLLRQTRLAPDTSDKSIQETLQEARSIVEQFKTAELEDYFQDDCVAALQSRTSGLDQLGSHTAVIYPIILQDRTELIVSLPEGIEQFTAPVNAESITDEIRKFRHKLEKRTTRQYLPHAQILYDWLIRPASESLHAARIKTLVIVPDGALRTIPWSALHDGSEFLIKNYAVAYTPGLQVTDPQALNREDMQVLLSGLTQSVQDFPSLPYVKDELEHINAIYNGTVLMDQDYHSENLSSALEETPFSIVHIASHGSFDSNPNKTFLLTYNGKINMDELEQFVGIGRFRDKPIELLTLSACQTAAGDDRAALGLAGIAVKSGARSALATLWFVNDQTTSLLTTDFYNFLTQAEISKAQALQKAQIKVLSDRRYRHPGYWSPYLLIGNWL
ncbi:MAG: CHAT domain-containing protein [Gammaproteobacteria bacterium]|nr:CHAT domain-containing protein [Gammaproteobacteria bacterium]